MNEQEHKTAKTLSIVSLVTSILGISLAGIICGHISLGKFKKAGNADGRGLALAGTIIGYIGLVIAIIFIATTALAFGKVAAEVEAGNISIEDFHTVPAN